MKIKKECLSQYLISDGEGMKNDFIKYRQQEIKKEFPEASFMDYLKDSRKIQENFDKWFTQDCKRYLITKPAHEIIDRIKLDKFDVNMFSKLPVNQTFEFVVSDDIVYRTFYNGKMLYGMVIHCVERHIPMIQEKPMIEYTYISWGYELNHETGEAARASQNEQQAIESIEQWARMLIFLQFSEVTEEIIRPRKVTGKTRKDKINNDTDTEYIRVTSKWNTTIIRKDGFKVSGHFRLQPYGPERKERRLIFIEEFEKKGYKRNAKNRIA